MWHIWIIIVIILLITLFRHPGALIAYFFISSLLTLISSFFLNNFLLEIILFLLVATLARLLLSNYFSKLNFFQPLPCTSTNNLINQVGIVLKPIKPHPFHTGLIHINHEVWIATSSTSIPKGAYVQIINVQGLRLTVIPYQEKC